MIFYTDMEHVGESLENALTYTSEGELFVIDAGQARVVSLDTETLKERNLGDREHVCYIEFKRPDVPLSILHLTLTFHESVVDDTFELRPAGHDAIAADQATSPLEISEKLKRALGPFAREHDAIFTFVGVKAASMANGGHFTDFEFEYAIDGVEL